MINAMGFGGTQYPDRLQQLSWKAPAEECSVLSQLVPQSPPGWFANGDSHRR